MLSLYFGRPLPYDFRFESENGLSVEIPAGSIVTAGPEGEVLVDGKVARWSDAPMAPGPRIACIVPAEDIERAAGVSVGARVGDKLVQANPDSATHGKGSR